MTPSTEVMDDEHTPVGPRFSPLEPMHSGDAEAESVQGLTTRADGDKAVPLVTLEKGRFSERRGSGRD